MTVPKCHEYRPQVLRAVSVEEPALVWGRGWFADVSTDSAPVLLFSKHPAKISIKLPEMLLCPRRRHSRDGEGSQLVGVTVPCKESFLGHSGKLCSLNKTRKFSVLIVCSTREGLRVLIKISSIFKAQYTDRALPWVPRELQPTF